MSKPTSKFPDLKEVGTMASKLFSDLKKSICEISAEYKEKHRENNATNQPGDITSSEHKAAPKVHKPDAKKPDDEKK